MLSKEAIAARIDERLGALGLSARAASIKAGLSADFVRDINRKPIVPRLDTLAQLARALETSPEWLAYGDDEPDEREFTRVPVISWVSASAFSDVGNEIEPERWLPIAGLGRGDFFALDVVGDSMDLMSPSGSTIIVDRNMTGLVNGRPYVFRHDNEATFKLWHEGLRALMPYSSNKAHEPIPVDPFDVRFGVIGRVRRTMLDFV